MKTLLNKVLEAIVVLLSIFILGLMIPILTSLVVVVFSNTQFDECVHTGLFWFITLLGWIISIAYMCYIYDNNKTNS